MTATSSTVQRLWALEGATFHIDRGLVMVGASGEITIPVPAFLIQHDRGLVLWDTGVSPRAQEDAEGVYGPLAEHLGLVFPEHARLDRQIEALGFALSDVTHVVLSHGHLDHAGGLSLFPHAKLYAGYGEIRYALWPDVTGGAFFRQADFEPLRGASWTDIYGDYDLFGDGSITILAMPGHTPGNLALQVRTASDTFILSGDTVHLQDAVAAEAPMPTDFDSRLARQSAAKLGLLRDSLGAKLWVCHDPGDWDLFKHAPYAYE